MPSPLAEGEFRHARGFFRLWQFSELMLALADVVRRRKADIAQERAKDRFFASRGEAAPGAGG
jgi:hypothetical protein